MNYLEATTPVTKYWKNIIEKLEKKNLSSLIPSIQEATKLELKILPPHLRCAYLGENSILPVIISSSLKCEEEKKLLRVLHYHKAAFGWTIVHIKAISPSLCIHKIQPECHLNLVMKEVVRKEVLKLLYVGIYPISHSS